jgi:hypothetical protein
MNDLILNESIVFKDGEIELKVSIENDTIWLKAKELEENSTCSILEQIIKNS